MQLTLFKGVKLGDKDRLIGGQGVEIRHEDDLVEVPTLTWWGSTVTICGRSLFFLCSMDEGT